MGTADRTTPLLTLKPSYHSRPLVGSHYLVDHVQSIDVSNRSLQILRPMARPRNALDESGNSAAPSPFPSSLHHPRTPPKPMSSTIASSAAALSRVLHQAWHSLKALCTPSTASPAPTQQAAQSVAPFSQTNRHSPSTTSSYVSESSPSTVPSSEPATEYLCLFEKK